MTTPHELARQNRQWIEGRGDFFDALKAASEERDPSYFPLPTGRCATKTIAASDASTGTIAQADYICDGTADEVQIQAAIDALTVGGTIHLSAGTFTLADEITMTDKDGIIIEGEGIFGTTQPAVGTVLKLNTTNKSVFVLSSCQGVTFRDFSAFATSTTGTIAIELVAACNNISFEELFLLTFDTLFDVSGESTELFWRKVQGGQGTTNYGIKMVTGQDVYITDSFFPTASDTGKSIYLSGIDWVHIIGCEIRDSGYGIYLTGGCKYIRVIGNTFGGLDYPGVCIYGNGTYPGPITIIGNDFDGCAANTTPGNPEDSNIYVHADGGGNVNILTIMGNSFTRGVTPHPFYGMYLANLGYNQISYNSLISGYWDTSVAIVSTSGGFTYPRDNASYIAPGEARTAIGSLTAGNANAFAFAWQNPEPQAVFVHRIVVDVVTAGGTATSVINVGSAANATTTSDNLIDGADLNSVDVYDNIGDCGTNGEFEVKLAANGGATDWITAQILVANAASLVGKYYIYYTGV